MFLLVMFFLVSMPFVLFFSLVRMAVRSLGERGIVARRLQAAAELNLDTLEIQFFQGKQCERLLIDRRRERFLTRGRVVTLQARESETTRQRPPTILFEDAPIDELIVVETGSDTA